MSTGHSFRNAPTELVDCSLAGSDAELLKNRRKVQLFSDRTAAYSSLRNDTISITVAPGSSDDWLDGRSSYITANLQLTGSGFSASSDFVYLPNGPASCFSQVQIISASGQQLANILDYGTIQQMFVEWTTCPTWKAGIGQMYGYGYDDELNQWRPAVYDTASASFAGYNPYLDSNSTAAPWGSVYESTTQAATAYTAASPAGDALALQADIGNTNTTGWSVAFRLDLAWLFGCPTLIPSQFFPLTIRATLQNPNRSLSYIGCNTLNGPAGPYSLAPAANNTNTHSLQALKILPASAGNTGNLDLTFNNVRFMASLVQVAPKFKLKVDQSMAAGTFEMNVTNYFAAQSNIPSNQNSANVNVTFSAHDCQAYYINLIPQSHENSLLWDFAVKTGGIAPGAATPTVASTQLLLNGRYWPPQPNQTLVDIFHDTLASFNTTSENVDFSPISFKKFCGKSFVIGTLLDRDPGSRLTGVDSTSSPVWTWVANFNGALNTTETVNVHTCIVFSQSLKVQKDGQIEIFQ